MRIIVAAVLICLPAQDDIEKLVKQLGASNFEEQGKAANALEKLGTKALPALEKAMKGDDAQVRDWASRIAARIEAVMDADMRALIQRLGSKDFAEQGRAADEIKALGAKAVPFLEEARRHRNADISAWADRLLREMRPKPAELGGAGGAGYGHRMGGRKALLEAGGGSAATEDAVLAALKWLARHQDDDGGWSAERFAKRCAGEEACRGASHEPFDAAVTGLALLAFLGSGFTHLSKDEFPDPVDPKRTLKFGAAVERGLNALLRMQDPEGCVGERQQKYVYHHAIATAALADAYGMTESAALKAPAQKAVDFLVAAQNPGKGWRYSTRSGDNDTSVTGWAVSALRAAEAAKLSFPKAAFDGALAWFAEVTDDMSRTGYTHKGTGKVFVPGKNEHFDHHETMTAAAMLGRVLIKREKKEDGLSFLDNDPPKWKPNKVDFVYWHYGTQAAFQVDGPGGPVWKRWNEALQDALVPNQGQAGCERGSWDPAQDRWGFEGGRVYATAINALTLETYYRHLRAAKK